MKGVQHQPAQTTQTMETEDSKAWQHMQGKPDSLDYLDAQPKPAGRAATPAQQSAHVGTSTVDVPSQAAMAAQIYSEDPTLPKQAAQGLPKSGPNPAGLSKWVPFHAVPKVPTAARPAEASGATYLTPSELQAIGR